VRERRVVRVVLEVLFLVALAVALGFAQLSPPAIVAVMLVAWALVALAELGAARDRPHFRSGLPPRYHVPRVSLPPPQPLEPVQTGRGTARSDEAPTWIAPPLRRAEPEDWPVAVLPPAAHHTLVGEAEPDSQSVPGRSAASEPALPAPVAAEAQVAAPEGPVPEPEAPPPMPEPLVLVPDEESGTAQYRLDPLEEPPRQRPWRRRSRELPAVLDVPARPGRGRPLPRRLGGGSDGGR